MRMHAAAAGLAMAAVLATAGCAAPAPAPAGRPVLGLRIEDAREKRGVDDILLLDLVFENRGATTGIVVKPQDGSFDRSVPPFLRVEMVDADTGEAVAPLERLCGNCGGEYTGSLRPVPPGEERTLRIATPMFPRKPGRYRVRLHYEIAEGTYPGPRVSYPTADPVTFGPWPEGVYNGALVSDPIEILVE